MASLTTLLTAAEATLFKFKSERDFLCSNSSDGSPFHSGAKPVFAVSSKTFHDLVPRASCIHTAARVGPSAFQEGSYLRTWLPAIPIARNAHPPDAVLWASSSGVTFWMEPTLTARPLLPLPLLSFPRPLPSLGYQLPQSRNHPFVLF